MFFSLFLDTDKTDFVVPVRLMCWLWGIIRGPGVPCVAGGAAGVCRGLSAGGGN